MHPRPGARSRLRAPAVCLALLGVVTAGCTATTQETTAPASAVPEDVAVNTDLGARLDELPLPSGVARDGSPEIRGSTIEQTYTVEGGDARSILEDLAPKLEDQGWQASDPPTSDGDGLRQTWLRDGDRLLLVTTDGGETAMATLDVLLTVGT